MTRAAVLLAPGFEEGEALFVVDVLRRAGISCDAVSVDGTPTVEGSHGIAVVADNSLDDSIHDYELIVLPGGIPGAHNLRDSPAVIAAVRAFDADPAKFIGAICAAPIVLKQAGISKGRRLTSYPGEQYESLFADADYRTDLVVVDEHLITSRGPATTLPFAYALVDALEGDSRPLRDGMLHSMLAESEDL